MRVLHVSSGNLYGGVETLLVTLARERNLAPMMQPEFALCFSGRLSRELGEAGVAVHDCGPVRISRPWTVARARRRLRALLRNRDYDAVVCHNFWPHVVFAPVVRSMGVPLVTWAHGAANGNWLQRWAQRTRPDLLIANSRFTLGTYESDFTGAKRQVVYCPVAVPPENDRAANRARVRAELGTGLHDVVIVCASRMEGWKGHQSLIAALATLAELPSWTAWIAGSAQRDSEREYLSQLEGNVRRGGLQQRVKFIGERCDISQVLSAADVYCQPNTEPEPFGIAFVEAMHAGLPVVTSAIGAAPELVKQGCGILVPPDDVGSLATALRRLIESPAERESASRASQESARLLCDPAKVLNELNGVLNEVAGRSLARNTS